jgi:hypothetical protein
LPYCVVVSDVSGSRPNRKSYSEDRPEVVALAHKLSRRRRKGWPLSLRQISEALAEPGHVSVGGSAFAATSAKRMLAQ